MWSGVKGRHSTTRSILRRITLYCGPRHRACTACEIAKFSISSKASKMAAHAQRKAATSDTTVRQAAWDDFEVDEWVEAIRASSNMMHSFIGVVQLEPTMA